MSGELTTLLLIYLFKLTDVIYFTVHINYFCNVFKRKIYYPISKILRMCYFLELDRVPDLARRPGPEEKLVFTLLNYTTRAQSS